MTNTTKQQLDELRNDIARELAHVREYFEEVRGSAEDTDAEKAEEYEAMLEEMFEVLRSFGIRYDKG